jgi:hypothetical protein
MCQTTWLKPLDPFIIEYIFQKHKIICFKLVDISTKTHHFKPYPNDIKSIPININYDT